MCSAPAVFPCGISTKHTRNLLLFLAGSLQSRAIMFFKSVPAQCVIHVLLIRFWAGELLTRAEKGDLFLLICAFVLNVRLKLSSPGAIDLWEQERIFRRNKNSNASGNDELNLMLLSHKSGRARSQDL